MRQNELNLLRHKSFPEPKPLGSWKAEMTENMSKLTVGTSACQLLHLLH